MLAKIRFGFQAAIVLVVVLWTVLHLTNAMHIPLGLMAG